MDLLTTVKMIEELLQGESAELEHGVLSINNISFWEHDTRDPRDLPRAEAVELLINNFPKLKALVLEVSRATKYLNHLDNLPWHIAHVCEDIDAADIEDKEGELVGTVYQRQAQSFITSIPESLERLRVILGESLK